MLKGTFEGHLVQPSCNEQGHLQLYWVAQSPIRPDLKHFHIKCGTLNDVCSGLNRPILSSYTTLQTPTTSSHLLAQGPALHQGDWAPVQPHLICLCRATQPSSGCCSDLHRLGRTCLHLPIKTEQRYAPTYLPENSTASAEREIRHSLLACWDE